MRAYIIAAMQSIQHACLQQDDSERKPCSQDGCAVLMEASLTPCISLLAVLCWKRMLDQSSTHTPKIGIPKNFGPFFVSPQNKDHSIFRSIIGPLIVGNSQKDLEAPGNVLPRIWHKAPHTFTWHKLGVLFVGALRTGALLFGACIWAPDTGKRPRARRIDCSWELA